MKIIPAFGQHYNEALSLLQQASLPVEDINDNVVLFVLQNNGKVIGTIGYETDGTTGLLRSLSVSEASRGHGHGEDLVRFLEENAKEKGIQTFYLLTTTATSFFARRGYSVINREDVPLFIRQSSEFSSVCPSSATVMKKDLV